MNKIRFNLVLFHHDLRVHDHPPLHAARQAELPVIACYVFNDTPSLKPFGFEKRSDHRYAFLLQTLHDLNEALSTLGIPFYVVDSMQEFKTLPVWSYVEVNAIFASYHPGSEEKSIIEQAKNVLNIQKVHMYWNQSLLHPGDYPFLMNALPGRFTDARMLIEQSLKVRPLLPIPQPQDRPLVPESTILPSNSISPRIHGGEQYALKHLHHYFFETKTINTYKYTRNNMLNFLDSSKLSPYLATGALSPRKIYWELKRFEQTIEKNVSTYWLWFELLWRDYFYFLHIKEGDGFFSISGSSSQTALWEKNETYQRAILQAKTGYPLVDANLMELYQTGWMSNRGRQNVASFISKSLRLDWRWGAALFEHYLLDYDVSSNYGNWQYIAGVGADPRENRLFNVSLQLKKYDAKGDYVKHWIPALKDVPTPELYQPWTMNALQQSMYQCAIGKDYPHPIIDDASIQLR